MTPERLRSTIRSATLSGYTELARSVDLDSHRLMRKCGLDSFVPFGSGRAFLRWPIDEKIMLDVIRPDLPVVVRLPVGARGVVFSSDSFQESSKDREGS